MPTNRDTLKGYFNTGDRPTEAQFAALIDNAVNLNDDKATQAEAEAGTIDTKYATPKSVKRAIEVLTPVATTSVKGLAETATIAEVDAGTDAERYVTPAGAKRAAEKHALVQKVNGISPVSGNITIPITDDAGWQVLAAGAFSNSTSSYDANTTVRCRARNGVVYLDGCIKGGVAQTNGTAYQLFTLPAGYAPARKMSFTLLRANTSLTTYTIGRIDINTNGAVYGVNYSDLWNSLSGIVFPLG